MPSNDYENDDLEQDEDLDIDSDSDETDEDEELDSSDGDNAGKKEVDKRIRDLQSKADAETARANKAEAALKSPGRNKGEVAGSNDPATSALILELREASLDAIFGEYPELKEYSIDRSLIEGTTRAEMRDAAASLVGLIKNVGSKARNKALADAGVKADPVGTTRSKPVNYATMSSEDFKKLLDSI